MRDREFRYTIFCSSQTNEYFWSTDHIQRFRSANGFDCLTFVPVSGTLPMSVVPRASLPTGIVNTIRKYLLIFHHDDVEIPNPDPAFQPVLPDYDEVF